MPLNTESFMKKHQIQTEESKPLPLCVTEIMFNPLVTWLFLAGFFPLLGQICVKSIQCSQRHCNSGTTLILVYFTMHQILKHSSVIPSSRSAWRLSVTALCRWMPHLCQGAVRKRLTCMAPLSCNLLNSSWSALLNKNMNHSDQTKETQVCQ